MPSVLGLPSGVTQEAVVGYLTTSTGWASSLLETVNRRPGESPGRGSDPPPRAEASRRGRRFLKPAGRPLQSGN